MKWATSNCSDRQKYFHPHINGFISQLRGAASNWASWSHALALGEVDDDDEEGDYDDDDNDDDYDDDVDNWGASEWRPLKLLVAGWPNYYPSLRPSSAKDEDEDADGDDDADDEGLPCISQDARGLAPCNPASWWKPSIIWPSNVKSS